ncbi:cuticlin-6-like [Glandiceps talaboti]
MNKFLHFFIATTACYTLIQHALAQTPVDGGWSSWNAWTDCTHYCDGGVRFRFRVCYNPPPQNGGADCSPPEDSRETELCNVEPCPQETTSVSTTTTASTTSFTTVFTTPVPAMLKDVVFLLDQSGSIGSDRVDDILEFIDGVIDQLDVAEDGVHVAMSSFAHYFTVNFNLDTYYDKEEMKAALQDIQYKGGSTDLTGALTQTHKQVFSTARIQADKTLLVLTDGYTTTGDIKDASDALRNDGVEIFAVAVGDYTNDAILLELAGSEDRILRGHKYSDIVDGVVEKALIQANNK